MRDQDSPLLTPSMVIMRDAARWPVTARQIVDRLAEEPDPLWQFQLHLDLAEVFIKLLGAWVLNSCRQSLKGQKDEKLTAKLTRLETNPSLGQWQGLLDLAKDSDLPYIREACTEDIRNQVGAIVTLRNGTAHQGTPNRPTLNRHAKEIEQALSGILTHLETSELRFECEPTSADPLKSAEWGRIYGRWKNFDADLFPWCIALYENDDPKALVFFDGMDSAKGQVKPYVNFGTGPTTLPAEAGKQVTLKCKGIFEQGKSPIYSEELIRERCERFSPTTEYITRNKCIESVLKKFDEFPEEMIFLLGDAGAGKTTLCCQLIGRIQSKEEPDKCIELHHFCGPEEDGSVVPEDIINNLTLQMRDRLGKQESTDSLASLVDHWLEVEENSLFMVTDGLDEIRDNRHLREFLTDAEKLKLKWPGAKLSIVFSGQPRIESVVYKVLERRPHLFNLDGFTFEEITCLVQKLELRNADWTEYDTKRLLKQTSGLALYIHSFLKNVSEGHSQRENIASLPGKVTEYWEDCIQQATRGLKSDDELHSKIEDAKELFGHIHDARPELIPRSSLNDLREVSGGVIRSHHSGDAKMILLYVLACFPGPLPRDQLGEMLGCSTKVLERKLKPFGSILDQDEKGKVSLCHSSVREFLWMREDGAKRMLQGDQMILDWLSEWRADAFKPTAWLDFLPSWNRRLLRARPDAGPESNSEAVASFLKRAANFEWLLWCIENNQIAAMHSIALSLLDDKPLERLDASLSTPPTHNNEDSRVVKQNITAGKRRQIDLEKEHEQRSSEYIDAQDNEPEEIFGGMTRADASYLFEAHEASDQARKERLKNPLPEKWFLGRFKTNDSLIDIRQSYNTVSESCESTTARTDPRRELVRICDFLENYQITFAEMQRISPEARREALARSIVRAAVFEESELQLRAAEIIASHSHPSIRIIPRYKKSMVRGEWLVRHIRGSFHFATEAQCLAVREEHRTGKDLNIEIYLFDWLKNREIARLNFEKCASVYLYGLRSDGEEVLLTISGKLCLMTWDGKRRELNVPEKSEVKWVNPDLRFVALAVAKNYVIYDCRQDHIVEPITRELSELNGVRLSQNGSLAVYLDYRSFSLWAADTSNSKADFWLGEDTSSNKKPYNFAISANGRFFYLRGQVWEISTGEVWRQIPDVSWNAQAAFSSDGRMLALIERTGELKVFDIQTGYQIAHIICRAGCEEVYPSRSSASLAFTPDGSFLLVESWMEAFSVIDLRRSSSPEAFKLNQTLVLDRDGTFLPVCPSIEQIVGITDSAISITDLVTHSIQHYGQKDLVAAYKNHEEIEEWEWSEMDCVGLDAYWCAGRGFVLDEFDKTNHTKKSTTCLLEQTDQIDWKAICQFQLWPGDNREEYSFEKLVQREWRILSFCDGLDDEIIAGAYPNILLHISLKERKILHAKNTEGFELNLETFALSEDIITFASQSGNIVGIWCYGTNVWKEKQLSDNDSAKNFCERAVPFPWKNKLALISDPEGVFGTFDYVSDNLDIYPYDNFIGIANMPAFSIPHTTLMLAVIKSGGFDHLATMGICLADPFSGETFAHEFFETPIRDLLRISEKKFCVVFEDGSFDEIIVNFA